MPYSFFNNVSFDRSRPLAMQVYETLLQAIVDQQLAPGVAINKEEVGKALGVSRTPVSEAIAKLTEDRLVEVFPQRGTYVAKIRIGDVKESAFIRQALEVAIARQVAEHHTDKMLEALTKNLRFQLFALYRGGGRSIQFETDPMTMVNIGSSLNVLKGKGTISFRVNDVFQGMRFKFKSVNPYPSTGQFNWESQTAYLGFSYRFGGGKNRALRRKNRDNNETQGGGGFL